MRSLIGGLRDALFAIPLMGQVFLIALVVPLLYWLTPRRLRKPLLLAISIFTLLMGGAYLEYLTLLALLIGLVWCVVPSSQPDPEKPPAPLSSWRVGMGVVLILLLSVSLGLSARIEAKDLTLNRDLLSVAFVAGIGASWGLYRLWHQRANDVQRRLISGTGIVLLVILFAIFKWPSAFVIPWFGFSYIAFRLLHILLERRLDQPLPAGSPQDLGIYALFFSAQAVGPIDRWPRFAEDIQGEKRLSAEDYVSGWERILIGAIKKFFIADLLLSNLLPDPALLNIPPVYAWIQLYAYAFYLYFDFSGFVDIAIGTARLLGFHLPENFDRPYTRGSLAQFWQSWHITLSGWLRTYIFLPLSRSLLRSRLRRSPLLIVLISNLVTMVLIGLWHGFTWNYVVWGLWHAIGLFIHKLFADRTRRLQVTWRKTWRETAFHAFSVFVTFHFVVIGWVFFALPTLPDSLRYLAALVGLPQ